MVDSADNHSFDSIGSDPGIRPGVGLSSIYLYAILSHEIRSLYLLSLHSFYRC